MHSNENNTDPIALLRAIARRARQPLAADNFHDPNVCTSVLGWREPLKDVGQPADRFRRCVAITHFGYRLTLRANDRFVMFDLMGAFDIPSPFSINRPDRVAGLRMRKTFHDWSVFIAGGSLPQLPEDADVVRRIAALELSEHESVHVRRNRLTVYARPASLERVDAILAAIVSLADRLPKAESIAETFEDLPIEFSALLQKSRDWIISDDRERHERLARASRLELAALVNSVMPFLIAIDQYLDRVSGNPSESAAALGALAECAAEARLMLTGTR